MTVDEREFGELVAPYRAELEMHCRRLLGSTHDAEDAMQEALIRAWRALPSLQSRAALRGWLYRIATNCALDISERRKPTVPIETETPMDSSTPETKAQQREVVELALVAAHDQLSSRQRAVLILREVLDFSACEVADSLATTPSAVNSALQRARATVATRPPEQDRLPAPASLADARLRRRVQLFAHAWADADVDGLVSMLAEDAA
ncbi:MAG TPA: sigma-70 family RNA polymerase sigma factor [Thermoleophilaceae bacterium]|nr:sigma-70 family RNA polymerase sigma factor [Thermoleophilaceae bacterium]